MAASIVPDSCCDFPRDLAGAYCSVDVCLHAELYSGSGLGLFLCCRLPLCMPGMIAFFSVRELCRCLTSGVYQMAVRMLVMFQLTRLLSAWSFRRCCHSKMYKDAAVSQCCRTNPWHAWYMELTRLLPLSAGA